MWQELEKLNLLGKSLPPPVLLNRVRIKYRWRRYRILRSSEEVQNKNDVCLLAHLIAEEMHSLILHSKMHSILPRMGITHQLLDGSTMLELAYYLQLF